MKQKFIFPLNYDYSAKFLGIIEYKLLTPLLIYGILIFLTLRCFELTFFTALCIFIFLFFPIALLLNSRFYTEPFYTFFVSIISHYIKSKIYLYKRVIWCGINLNCFFCTFIASYSWSRIRMYLRVVLSPSKSFISFKKSRIPYQIARLLVTILSKEVAIVWQHF
jgi:hypothetical protein